MRRPFAPLLLALIVALVVAVVAAASLSSPSVDDSPIPPTDAPRSRRRAPSAFPRKSSKPKRYKCVLVDDDEEEDEQPAVTLSASSYVAELQQRRALAAAKAAAAATATRDHAPQSVLPGTRTATPVRPSLPVVASPAISPIDAAATAAADAAVAAELLRPLKPVTIARPTMVAAPPAASLRSYPSDGYETSLPARRVASPAAAVAPSPAVAASSLPRVNGAYGASKLTYEHCSMIKQYASMYMVNDVKSWVHKNCSFARMYLPNATCDEIDQLVASCYRL